MELKTGFRLSHFEFYNWGTYNKNIYNLDLNQENALLTGDIGSGKSTVVDALTTLLVPHQKIVYNKAAGASGKERSLRSYILGEYKSSKDENYTSSKAIALRDETSFSVLLARFDNNGFDESLTIAQFFYMQNAKEYKFFIVSQDKLSIKKDFLKFKDIKALKKRLKTLNHTRVYESFKDYSKDFRRVVGIKNEQALNLFYQTVSLKEIGNLTSFIRLHMLQKGNIDAKVDELCKNFADLNHAHNSVLRAKRQIELLTPIAKDGKRYRTLIESRDENEKIRDVLNIYFANIEISLVNDKIEELEIELKKAGSNKIKVDEDLDLLRQKELELKIELEQNGGNRINSIQSEIKTYTTLLDEKKRKNHTYNELAKSLEFSVASNEHRFLNNINDATKSFEQIQGRLQKIQDSRVFDEVSKNRYKNSASELEVEIAYLKNNPSNIPQKISKIRDKMAEELHLNIEALPFVGELIKVVDAKWEGAIERVLHGFALSLLVSEEYYDEVSRYVDSTNLKGKLVYLKVLKHSKRDSFVDILPNSLIRKIEIKADSFLFEPLYNMLNDRFNISCVESLDEFRRFKKALTIHGQFKTNLSRHEKDDRFDIEDRSRWILGWDNLSKLSILQEQHSDLSEKIKILDTKIASLIDDEANLQNSRDLLRDLLNYKEFSEIDWYSISRKIDELNEEKEILEKSSDLIQTLEVEIQKVTHSIKDMNLKVDKLSKNIGGFEANISNYKIREIELNKLLDNLESLETLEIKIDELFANLIKEKTNLVNIKLQQSTIRANVQAIIDSTAKSITRVGNSITKQMSLFAIEFPTSVKDFDVALESLDEFIAQLNELKKDDLPRWEKRFNDLLKEGTIRNILLIQEELEHQSGEIKSKIEMINHSLKDIEYNDGTFVELIAENGADSDIREFRQSLKNATTGSIGDDNSYDENKFAEIKNIIDRFNGREGKVDIDKKWTQKVTDVRNWFNFAASERYLSDGSEKEYYAHSGGKSGGQKEKLAYTVLASSLAFQFGIQYDKVESRTFRFVMIDEAFGRGSDESTKYALRLFDKLKLQLLVITPKQKINVIESFVKTVHFVANPDGMNSSILSMSIEDYKKNKK